MKDALLPLGYLRDWASGRCAQVLSPAIASSLPPVVHLMPSSEGHIGVGESTKLTARVTGRYVR